MSDKLPSWQTDPFGRHEQRWWDGGRWTEKVRSGSTTSIDPPGIVARPENRASNDRVAPITDATVELPIRSPHLPRVILAALLLVLLLVVLVLVGVLTD